MQLLFIADPLESFKIHKDTTYAMMREAQARGHTIWACEAADLHWRGGKTTAPTLAAGAAALSPGGAGAALGRPGVGAPTLASGVVASPPGATSNDAPLPTLDNLTLAERPGVGTVATMAVDDGLSSHVRGPVTATCRQIVLQPNPDPKAWFNVAELRPCGLHEFDAVLMRKDPPFDSEYFYATHLLEQAEREGARVFNSPRALRDHPEKLSILEWPQFAPATLVSRRASDLKSFFADQGDVIFKPLDGMGGTGIFRLRRQPDGSPDPNLNVVIETLTDGGRNTIMAQRFMPEISAGDKRVLIIDGEPVPYCLARIPQGGETRGNLAAGGLGIAQPLTDGDWAIARTIGPVLARRGLLLIGIDIIGTSLTEINVTSPTCFQEISQQTDCDVARLFIDALERQLNNR